MLLVSAGIIGLIGMAAFLTIYIMEDSANVSGEENPASVAADENSVQISPSSYSQEGYEEREHCLLFVGDSRTLGMQDAVLESAPEDPCTCIAMEGEGYRWFYNEGIVQLEESLSQNPSQIVVLNLGVNDLEEIQNYLSLYEILFEEYPQTSFHIMSVNPVDEELFDGVTNEEIETFNQQMQEAFPARYLDCYSYLLTEGYQTVDGLHYNGDTYRSIHHFVVASL